MPTTIKLKHALIAYAIISAALVGNSAEWHRWSCPQESHVGFALFVGVLWPVAAPLALLNYNTNSRCSDGSELRKPEKWNG